jgi:DNA invertase Pin-like site-specific DNA recombinase
LAGGPDELVVHSMDRLARSLVDLRRTVDELTDRGVSVRFVKENLTFTADHSDPCGVLMLSVTGAFAEFERSLILERQREGSQSPSARASTRAASPR